MNKLTGIILSVLILVSGCIQPGASAKSEDAYSEIDCSLQDTGVLQGASKNLEEFKELGVQALELKNDFNEYLPRGSAPHKVSGEFTSLEIPVLDAVVSGSQKKLDLVTLNEETAFLEVERFNGKEIDLSFEDSLKLESGDANLLSFTTTSESVMVLDANYLYLSKVRITGNAVDFKGRFTGTDEKGTRMYFSLSIGRGPVLTLKDGFLRINREPSYDSQATIKVNGSVNLNGEKLDSNDWNGLRLKGLFDIEDNTFTGNAFQVFNDDQPLLKSRLELSKSSLCFNASDNASFNVPIDLRESSGNADAVNVKAVLFSNSESVNLGNSKPVEALNGLEVEVESLNSLSPGATHSLRVFINKSEREINGVLHVTCDNCEGTTIPLIVKSE